MGKKIKNKKKPLVRQVTNEGLAPHTPLRAWEGVRVCYLLHARPAGGGARANETSKAKPIVREPAPEQEPRATAPGQVRDVPVASRVDDNGAGERDVRPRRQAEALIAILCNEGQAMAQAEVSPCAGRPRQHLVA